MAPMDRMVETERMEILMIIVQEEQEEQEVLEVALAVVF
jgi:hypothetical protein